MSSKKPKKELYPSEDENVKGASIISGAEFTRGASDLNKLSKKCRHCGVDILPYSRFCHICGKPQKS